MLILQRKTSEGIIINERITVRVLGVRGGRVKLGIDAGPADSVIRQELIACPPEQPDIASSSVIEPPADSGQITL